MKRPQGSLISYFSNRVKKEGGINLAQGTPGFPPPSELLELLSTLSTDNRLHQYAPGVGNYSLLEMLADKFSKSTYTTVDNLLMVQGATEGIFLSYFYLSTILDRPFSALSFDPVYESYPMLSHMLNIPFVYQDLESDLSVDFDALEASINAQGVKVIFVASPGNPLGKVWNRAEMEQLTRLAHKYDAYILFDAVYKDIYFEDPPFNPLELNDERIFYIDSFSKTLSITGWRVGYMITSTGHMENIRHIHDYTGLCVPSILQSAIGAYLAQADFSNTYREELKQKCRRSYEYAASVFTDLGFDVAPIQGGYFLWARLPEPLTSGLEFAQSLYESVQLGVVPGENFSPVKADYIRVNIAVEPPVMQDAAQRLRVFFEQQKQKSLKMSDKFY